MADCQKLEGGRSITLGLTCFSVLALSNHFGLLRSVGFKPRWKAVPLRLLLILSWELVIFHVLCQLIPFPYRAVLHFGDLMFDDS